MGRNTKEKNDLLKKVFIFKDDKSVQEKLKVCLSTLESLMKSRSSERRKHFKSQMEQIFKNLCVDSRDKEMFLKKITVLREEYAQQSTKRTELQDQVNTLQHKISELREFKERFNQQTKAKHAAEADYGKMQRENDKLLERVDKLKAKLKKKEKD